MITAEVQKGHVYYRCTKKGTNCNQPYIREEELDRQLSTLLQKVSLREDWAEKLLTLLKNDQETAAQSCFAFAQEAQEKIKTITTRLQRLLDGYLEQDIDRDAYRAEKAKLILEKKSLEERLMEFEQKQNNWLEPFRKWIKVVSSLEKTARDTNLFAKKVAAEQVFGSNLRLAAREARGEPILPYSFARSAKELVGQKPEREILELTY